MNWREFHDIREGLRAAEALHTELLQRRTELFQMTQPGAIRYDQDKVQTSGGGDKLAAYMERMDAERLEERIRISKQHVEEWSYLYGKAITELRQSRDSWDRIYVFHFIDHVPVPRFRRLVGYSEQHIYRIIRRMKRERKC